MHPVKSSQISEIGHDPETNTLHVKFIRGGHYSYAGVDADKFEKFKASPSQGTFLGREIKPNHAFTKHS